MHQRRKYDFNGGRLLGVEDHVVRWTKPQRPGWMDETMYAQFPEGLSIGEPRVKLEQADFRVNGLILVTTLLDAERYSKEELA